MKIMKTLGLAGAFVIVAGGLSWGTLSAVSYSNTLHERSAYLASAVPAPSAKVVDANIAADREAAQTVTQEITDQNIADEKAAAEALAAQQAAAALAAQQAAIVPKVVRHTATTPGTSGLPSGAIVPDLPGTDSPDTSACASGSASTVDGVPRCD